MKLKTTAVALGCLSMGVVLGAFATAWLMSGHRVPMSATPLMVEMPGHLTIEIGSDAHKGVTLRRGSQEILIPPPQNIIWTRMLVAKSANEAFLLAHKEIGQDMCHWPSLYRVALPGAVDSVSNYNVAQVLSYAALTNMVGDALIGEVHGASDDGKRLLLTLAFREPANNPSATYIRHQSYYFYPENETNRLIAIVP